MKVILYSVFDHSINAFMPPSFFVSHAQARRAWQEECAKPESPFRKYPNDYHFEAIGTLDDRTGQLENLDERIRLSVIPDVSDPQDQE